MGRLIRRQTILPEVFFPCYSYSPCPFITLHTTVDASSTFEFFFFLHRATALYVVENHVSVRFDFTRAHRVKTAIGDMVVEQFTFST
jgi:hypothetical protein